MSMFSLPDGFGTNANMMDQMMQAYGEMMKPVTGSADALAMPAAFMAMPALGAGMMAQFWGAMAGTVQGACGMARRMPEFDAGLKAPVMFWKESDEDTDAFASSMVTPFSFFAGAAKTFVADMEHAAQDMVIVGEHFAEGVAEDTEAVTALVRDAGATLLMVSHDPADARRIADEVILVEAGLAHPPQPTAALLDNPPPALRAYLG